MKLNWAMPPLTVLIALVLCSCAQLWSQSTDQSAPEPSGTLPAGTIIRLRTVQEVDSKHAKDGDMLPLEVMRDVKVGELVVIAKHTPVAATLAQVHRAPRGLRRGSLALEVKTISDIAGNPIAVKATRRATGPGDRQAEAYTEAVLSMGFLAPPLIFLHGDEAVLPRGAEIDPTVSQDVALNVSALSQRWTALEAERAAAREQSRTGQATVHFYLHPRLAGQRHPVSHNSESRTVLVDGQKVVRLRDWSFYDDHIAPGHHVVACNGPKLELDTKADEQYYVNITQEYDMWAVLGNHWVPRLIDPETGEDEIYPLIPAPKKDVYSASR